MMSHGELGARLAIAALLVGAAVPAYRYAELSFLRENDPEAAYSGHPADARALAYVVGQRFAAKPDYIPDAAERVNLQQATVMRPLSAELLSVHGLIEDGQAKSAEALASMQLANRISRRGAIANLWLIESASGTGNVRDAVKHYDVVLSVHPGLRETLLPLLARAVAYPEVRQALLPYLSRPRNWTGQFLQAAVIESRPADLEALLTPVPASLRDEAYRPIMALVLQRLATESGYRAAMRFARDLIPDLDPRVLSMVGPSAETLDPRLGPLAWQFPDDAGGVATEARRTGEFDVTVQPLANGIAVHRDVLLESGKTYAFSQRVSLMSGESDVGLTWKASCKANGQMTNFWENRLSSGRLGLQAPKLMQVPPQCSAVTLALSVEGPDGQSPVTARISDLQLKIAK